MHDNRNSETVSDIIYGDKYKPYTWYAIKDGKVVDVEDGE